MKKTTLLLFLLLAESGGAYASVQRTVFHADVVASACHVSVEVAGPAGNRLTFGTYRKSLAVPVPAQDFTLSLTETGASVQGCSAFHAGRLATISFGNPGQLDEAGVVTQGAGDGVRIAVHATDAQADYRGRLNASAYEVNYPVAFAAKGRFRFQAQPVIPPQVKAGEYHGALSFVVTYQ